MSLKSYTVNYYFILALGTYFIIALSLIVAQLHRLRTVSSSLLWLMKAFDLFFVVFNFTFFV